MDDDIGSDEESDVEEISSELESEEETSSGIDDEIRKQESIETEIIAYLKNLRDSETTYGDLLRYVSRLRSVDNPDDAKHHIISALKNKKNEGLSIEKKGARIEDSDVIRFSEPEVDRKSVV